MADQFLKHVAVALKWRENDVVWFATLDHDITFNCIRCPFTVNWSSPSSVAFARPIRTESISELSACIVSNPTSFLIARMIVRQ
jgi:hypothetical protein